MTNDYGNNGKGLKKIDFLLRSIRDSPSCVVLIILDKYSSKADGSQGEVASPEHGGVILTFIYKSNIIIHMYVYALCN